MAAQQDGFAVDLAIAVGCPQLTYGCPDYWYGHEKKEEVVFVGKSVVKMKFKKPYPENKYHTVSDYNKESHSSVFPVCPALLSYLPNPSKKTPKP